MMILDEKDGGDSELLVYAMTLVNKVGNTNKSYSWLGYTLSAPRSQPGIEFEIGTHVFWHFGTP